MVHDLQENNNRPDRPPSPSSLAAATNLLRFVSGSPTDATAPLFPASLLAFPPSQFFPHQMMRMEGGLMPGLASGAATAIRELIVAANAGRSETLQGSDIITKQNTMTATIAISDQEREAADKHSLMTNKRPTDGTLHDSSPASTRHLIVKRPIDHAYTDYAPISDDELKQLDIDDSMLNCPTLSPKKRSLLMLLRDMPTKSGAAAQSFPAKLHAAISNPEFSDIISWMPHGRCFAIHDHDALVKEVLPRYFNQTKFVSFIRQLNLWGFKRVTRGVYGKTYYHELFLRGRPYMSLRLKRHKIKGHGFKPIPNPKGEPNFYSYSQVGHFLTAADKSKSLLNEDEEVHSKRQIVTSREVEHATGNNTLLSSKTAEKEPRDQDQKDNLYSSSEIAPSSAPPATTDAPATIARASVSSLGVAAADRANLAARYTSLMQLPTSVGNEYGLPLYSVSAQSNTDEMLLRRLAQLHREQIEIDLCRRAYILENLSASSNSALNPFHSKPSLGALSYATSLGLPRESTSGFSPSFPSASNAAYGNNNPLHMSVAGAMREAKHFEELASASRNRARILALGNAIEPQTGHEVCLHDESTR